jgi:hypothetical protein
MFYHATSFSQALLTDFKESTNCATFVNGADVIEQICGVRSLLREAMNERHRSARLRWHLRAAGTGFRTRNVTVTGTSLLQVGDSGRRLATVGGSLGRRELQESGEQEASISISVETVVPENSGGFIDDCRFGYWRYDCCYRCFVQACMNI